MQSMAELLKRNLDPRLGKDVSRAMVLEAANAWLAAKNPALATRARVKSEVGGALVVQCASGVAAAEVRHLAAALLNELRERYPGYKITALKCLVRGGNVDDEA